MSRIRHLRELVCSDQAFCATLYIINQLIFIMQKIRQFSPWLSEFILGKINDF